jgi:DNA-binding CsgD family transcriptional regulator
MVSVSSTVATGRLLERDAELARVERAFDRVGVGVGAVVVVEGPAGIGKSELLAAVGAGARGRGLGVLAARGSEFEQEIAFGIARQLFEPMLRAASPPERRRLLDGVARVGARALGVEAGEAPADRFAAIHGLYWLAANRAERGPLVLAVDDVQWVDDPSLAWLGYVARRAGDLPLGLVLGLRSGDPGGERPELVRLVGDGGVERIVLGPLSAAGVSGVVRATLDEEADEPFCAACSELTGGNPLFVRELLAAARDEGLSAREADVQSLRRIVPAGVGISVLARLGRLGTEAVALARAVAVLGPGSEVMLAAQLAGVDPVAAELAADRLGAAQIFAPTQPLEFVHPLIGEAVVVDIAPGERRVSHRRAAELLDRGGGSLGRVAAHLLECGPRGDQWALGRLRDAASEALERGAPEIATDYLRRALREPPTDPERASLLLMLGTAEWRAGAPDAIAHLEQALVGAGEDLATVIATATVLAPAYRVFDRTEQAVEVLERALAALKDANPQLGLVGEAAIVAIGLMSERTATAAVTRAEALRSRLGGLIDPPVHVLTVLAVYAALTNRATEAVHLVQRALACQPSPPPTLWTPLISALTLAECYDRAQRLCDDLIAAGRGRSAVQEIAGMTVFRARARCDCGALADAEADARWALENGDGVRRIAALSELIRVLIERDALDEAEHELAQLGNSLSSDSAEMSRLVFARGLLRAAQTRHAESLKDLQDVGRRCIRLGLGDFSGVPWRAEAALVQAALGNAGDATRLAHEQLELARAFDRPRTLGLSLRAAALVQGGDAGLALHSEAVKTLEGSQSQLELARVLTDYGAALRRAGRRIAARDQLARALDLAHHCGAWRIAAHARGELIAAGAKPRRDAITGRDALTASELRVARLAAEGLTNREIAQALFITTRTAKVHLNRVYRKLNITRRGQLTVALTGLLDDSREQPSATAPATS